MSQPEKSAKILAFPHCYVCPRWEEHAWKEDYYGTGCEKCDLWFPHGGAPWDDPWDEGAEAEEAQEPW